MHARTVVAAMRAERRRRQALRPLRQAEDWQLDDLGLTRADVARSFAMPLWMNGVAGACAVATRRLEAERVRPRAPQRPARVPARPREETPRVHPLLLAALRPAPQASASVQREDEAQRETRRAA